MPLWAAGYSFGAWLALATGAAHPDVSALIGIAPPLDAHDTAFVALVKDRTGSFSGALPVIAVVLLVSMILPLVVRRPGARREGPFHRGPLRRAGVGARSARSVGGGAGGLAFLDDEIFVQTATAGEIQVFDYASGALKRTLSTAPVAVETTSTTALASFARRMLAVVVCPRLMRSVTRLVTKPLASTVMV